MARGKGRNGNQKSKTTSTQPKSNGIDEKILTQAIVNGYQIIQEKNKLEKAKAEEHDKTSKKTDKEKWYINLLFMLNVLAFPWKIHRRFKINDQIYDGILVLFVSLVLGFWGVCIRIIGLCSLACGVIIIFKDTAVIDSIEFFALSFLMLVVGSFFILASSEFSKVSDSNRIYAYSSSIIALLSCIIAVISMIK